MLPSHTPLHCSWEPWNDLFLDPDHVSLCMVTTEKLATALSSSKLLHDCTVDPPIQVCSETTSFLEYYVISYNHRPHLQSPLYTGELLTRLNTNVQFVSTQTQMGGQTVLTRMFLGGHPVPYLQAVFPVAVSAGYGFRNFP